MCPGPLVDHGDAAAPAPAPRKLLFFVEHFDAVGAGAENYAVAVCRALAARGYEIHVLAEDGRALPNVTLHLGLKHASDVQHDTVPDMIIDWAFLHDADIHRLGGGLHAEYLRHSRHAYAGPARWLRRLVWLQPRHRRLIRREAHLAANAATTLLANSDFVREQACARGADPNAVTVLYNGVDIRRFHRPDGDVRQTLRQGLGLADDAVACVFAAHNLRLKNLALLRAVFRRLHPRLPGLRLVVVGKRAPAFAAPWLIYRATTARIEDILGAADVLLHPTYFDACANVVLEAMASELPVIVSDRSGVHGLLRSWGNGVVLPVTGPHGQVTAAWAEALRRLALEPATRARLGRAGRATAEEQGFDLYMDKFERLLQRVYAARRRPQRSHAETQREKGKR